MKTRIIKNEIKITEGAAFVCETLTWDDGWEFEHPSLLLSPIIRCFENGWDHEQIVESVMIEAVTSRSGKLVGDNFERNWGWRGYKLPVLRRRFKESLGGKHFPVADYRATREIVKIIRDRRGELTWETIPETKPTHGEF